MSDSEDDFMSDKFLVDTAPAVPKSYTAKRSNAALKSLRAGQAKNAIPLKQLEKERRDEGLRTSLFDIGSSKKEEGSGSGSGGGNKAMEMMMKMGWKVGQGLGKKRSPSPDDPSSSSSSLRSDNKGKKRFRPGLDEDDDVAPSEDMRKKEVEPPRRGLGATSATGGGSSRTEPIRISLWAGRKGLSARARTPSPPPLASRSNRDPDALDPRKLERLSRETQGFRERQQNEYGERERERKERAARDKLVQFDHEIGLKYHPLHALPSDPIGSLPRSLLRLIYPAQVFSPSPSPSRSPTLDPIVAYEKDDNLSAAEKIRLQMRRDMLSSTVTLDNEGGNDSDDDEGDGPRRFGILPTTHDEGKKEVEKVESEVNKMEDEYVGVDWEEMVDGTKRVLAMDPATHLTFLVSQLRHEHLFCFWCAYKYKSYEEMEGVGGCPGEDEDDH